MCACAERRIGGKHVDHKSWLLSIAVKLRWAFLRGKFIVINAGPGAMIGVMKIDCLEKDFVVNCTMQA
jgi:hypothetical protein